MSPSPSAHNPHDVKLVVPVSRAALHHQPLSDFITVSACRTKGSHLIRLSILQFGYTRKDVILLGVGILGFGYALYYGLQAAGFDALVAGNIVQIFVFLGIGVGYISTYIFRVANKVCLFVDLP